MTGDGRGRHSKQSFVVLNTSGFTRLRPFPPQIAHFGQIHDTDPYSHGAARFGDKPFFVCRRELLLMVRDESSYGIDSLLSDVTHQVGGKGTRMMRFSELIPCPLPRRRGLRLLCKQRRGSPSAANVPL